jgi:hypothetical protein
MKSALFLLIFLIGATCMAQNHQEIIQNNPASLRTDLFNKNISKNVSQLKNRPNFRIHEKTMATSSPAKQKTLIQSIDSVYMWRWDTNNADWALDYKYHVEEYDASYNPISVLGQNWDGSVWVNADRSVTTYDNKNNPLDMVWQVWTGTDWENDQKGSYEYDANNNMLTESVAYWDGSTWVNSMLIVSTYDANSNQTSYLHQNWNGAEWENYWQETYTYDVNNNLTGSLHQDWIDNQWVDKGQNTYVYDNNNKLIQSVTQVDNGAELVTSEVAYFYNEDNRLISDSTHTWGNSWDYRHLGTYAYDANGNLLSWLLQSINGENLEYVTRTIFTYDAANNRTSELRQDWKDNSWVNLDLDRHSFNEYNFLISDAYKYWNSAGTEVMDGDSSAYYYHDAVTGIIEIENPRENIRIYPNPAYGKFTITTDSNIQSIVIFNLSGKLIYSDSGFIYQKEIDLSGYDKGVYLLKIQTGKGIEAKKIIIR